jgi:hypothetical protein
VLTKAHRQEALSRAYVQAVIACAGLTYSRPDQDYGIDLLIHEIDDRGGRLTDRGPVLGLQLKCTTRAVVSPEALAYDLDVKNYDDLRGQGPGGPRLLVVVILPPDEMDWLSFGDDGMTVRGRAYWRSLVGAAPTAARRTVRVTLPREQAFTPAALRVLIRRIREGKAP